MRRFARTRIRLERRTAGAGAQLEVPGNSLLGLALRGHRGSLGRDGLLVAKVVVLDRFEVLVELIHQRHARGDVVLEDLRLADVVQVLDQRA